MKLRVGFVSNSSSSSFVCCLCGETNGGYDATYEEFGFCCCVNGHEICQDHAINDGMKIIDDVRCDPEMVDFDLLKEVVKHSKHWQISRDPNLKIKIDNASNFDELKEANGGNLDDIGYEMYSEMPAMFCPVCQLKDIPDEDMLTIMLYVNNCSREDVRNFVTKEFPDYDAFRDALNKMRRSGKA